ncbi:Probable RNA-directed DNA polymerase from transposon X-element [Eumeta japonica]|uniref:Probable RNA-directed DNA polymerase from transposon X-element n=1 Tax=Eumeta variegata TaxID=151549 RepID=A0A4C1X9W2_EUMVA|nr:Probable RNA-directed DNA polymerase from transposon X-element [Eumeta japonica]
MIAEYLAEQFTPNLPATSPLLQEHYVQVEAFVRKVIETPLPTLPGDLFITPAALHKIVIRLPKKKASRSYGISTGVLRHLPRRATMAMHRVFNGIFRTSHFLKAWKRGKIITIPKAGKYPQKPENIGPITLLSHMAKAFECALLTKLRLFLSPRQKQYGFRSGYSTTLQLIRVLHHLASEKNCEQYTVAVILDMEKPSTSCGMLDSSTNSWTPRCRLHLQESSPVLSNNAVSALQSTACYPPPARYEQKCRRTAAYPLSYTRYT